MVTWSQCVQQLPRLFAAWSVPRGLRTFPARDQPPLFVRACWRAPSITGQNERCPSAVREVALQRKKTQPTPRSHFERGRIKTWRAPQTAFSCLEHRCQWAGSRTWNPHTYSPSSGGSSNDFTCFALEVAPCCFTGSKRFYSFFAPSRILARLQKTLVIS